MAVNRKKAQSLKDKPILVSHYKDYITEYHPTGGWMFFKKGEEFCTVVAVEHKKDLIPYIERDIKERNEAQKKKH